MSKKRVFILGAGFSKQAGMPLATELTSLILDAGGLRGAKEMQEWVADLKKRLAAMKGAGAGASHLINVEQLFDMAKYDEELWRMRQQECTVGRQDGVTPWGRAESISTWLGYMEKALGRVMWDAQKKADVAPIKRFTDHLSSDDTIITFNYDTLVEAAMSSQGQFWHHGLSDSNDDGVAVLKMHGSIDWILLERKPVAQLDKFVKLFSKTDTNVDEHGWQPPLDEEYAMELWRAKDESTCDAVIGMDKTGLSMIHYRLGLTGLGRYKPLHALPGSAPTWIRAFKSLSEAAEIYVIGFSMSPYDMMTRFHFTSVFRARANPPEVAVVIDPHAADLADSFFSVFGISPTLMAKRAQDVDWDQVMN